jgi:hypothetical protein
MEAGGEVLACSEEITGDDMVKQWSEGELFVPASFCVPILIREKLTNLLFYFLCPKSHRPENLLLLRRSRPIQGSGWGGAH